MPYALSDLRNCEIDQDDAGSHSHTLLVLLVVKSRLHFFGMFTLYSGELLAVIISAGILSTRAVI